MFVIAALYKFFKLENPQALATRIKKIFDDNGILGTIILATEGINGTVCGSRQAIDNLKELLDELKISDGGQYKEATHAKPVFRHSKVKIKDEIVTFGPNVDPTKVVGDYVKPEKWNDLISDPEVTLIDTRNDYEFKIGSFKKAINPHTENFREFPDFVEKKLKGKEDKPVAMMCTGGVRCEKSTSYLKEKGFNKVYHLEGGILKYLEDVPAEKSLWQGECYVFDDRVSVKHGLEKGQSSVCYGCGTSLLPEETKASSYEKGVTCPSCINQKSASAKERLRRRTKFPR